jgi:hypothetical protein
MMVAALVAGTVVAMGVTQGFRSDGTVISDVGTRWKSPAQRELAFEDIPEQRRRCPGFERSDEIPISFFLNRDDTVDLAVVDAEDRDVRRVLAADLVLEGDRRHCVLWDRRDESGELVRPGAYRLRVSLEQADRVATAGEAIRVTRSVPRAEGGG